MRRKTYGNVLKAGKLIEKKGYEKKRHWKSQCSVLITWQP